MNLEELKSVWNAYDKQLQSSKVLNEKLVRSMIKERSQTRMTKVRQENKLLFIVMIIELLFIGAILVGNPFDFVYTAQYIPFILLSVGIVLALINIYKNTSVLSANLSYVALDSFLKNVINEYEKNRKLQQWFGGIMLASACLVIVAFLPNKLENKELIPALTETAVMIAITLAVYFLMLKSGIFKTHTKEEFQNDLKELEDLKALVDDLHQV